MAVLLPLAATAAASTRLAVGVLLGSAGAAKLRRRADFTGTLAAYRLLPLTLVGPAALLIAGAELSAGLMLVTGLAVPLATAIGALLLMAFAAGMGINLRRGRNWLDCGCSMTGGGQPIDRRLVARNLLIAAGLVLSGGAALPVGSLLWLSAGATAGLMLLLYHLFNLLVALSRRQTAKR